MITIPHLRLYKCSQCRFQCWYIDSDMRRILAHKMEHLAKAVEAS